MTMQELLVSSLKRLGAAGLAHPDYLENSRYDQNLGFARYWPAKGASMVTPESGWLVVWASADGTLFPSAEERDAYTRKQTGIAKTNEHHYGEKATDSNASGLAFLAECPNTGLGCEECRLNASLDPIPQGCSEVWDKSPYGMPLDKRIPWPKP